MDKEEQYFKQKLLKDAHLGIVFKDETKLYNPLFNIPEILEEQPELYLTWVMSRPEYFYMACKCILNVEIHPFQGVILKELWNHKFPMLVGSRGLSKTWCLAVYALLRALLIPNRKILICSAGFRQAKFVFNYMETMVSNSPILKDILYSNDSHPINKMPEAWDMRIGDSSIKAIPLGNGTTIRGLRCNDIIADEFDSIPVEVFETVVQGFASVSSSPVANAGRIAREKLAKSLGLEQIGVIESNVGNQIIISGTAGYSFKHFARYHERYVKFVQSEGKKERLTDVFGDDGVPDGSNWKDFSVMRIPVELLPEGYMDPSLIARAKATTHTGTFQMEFGGLFSSDSNGFFPRSIIEKCVVKAGQPMVIKGVTIPAEDIEFYSRIYGHPDKQYIMGIDPAMSVDNFAIVILEIHENHRRIVYCWTTNEVDYKNKYKAGTITETNYYSYCIKKIRQLYRDFNIIGIAIDREGGGKTILEGLNDEKLISTTDTKLWPVIVDGKPQDTDCHDGMHIIEVVSFTREEYTSGSNHGLRKDLEERFLLFPVFDAISLAEADITQTLYGKDNEEEKAMMEIEELKDELCTIVVTSTSTTNRERFDTPETKTAANKKGRLKKDRYSALLMANMTARTLFNKEDIDLEVVPGGFATRHILKSNEGSANLFTGPAWLAKQLTDLYR